MHNYMNVHLIVMSMIWFMDIMNMFG